MTNTMLLNQCIEKKGVKKSFIAEQIGISPMSLRNKISGLTEFKISEVLRMQEILGLNDEETRDIFLSQNVN